jgi:RNA recognition motif-containing protein
MFSITWWEKSNFETVYLLQVPQGTSEEQLRQVFEQFGPVKELHFLKVQGM